MIKISIIIPVYNAENYLSRSVGSILSQESDEFELILVDDGSKDSSPDLCDNYKQVDSRVVVYHKTNGGASSARNKGIENARGEWVVFLDADDEVSPQLICSLLESIKGNITDIIFYGYKMVFSDRSVEKCLDNKILDSEDFSYVFTDCEIYTPWSKAFKRELLMRENIWFDTELRTGEDTLFMFQYLAHVRTASTMGDILYIHYVIEGSLSAVVVPYNLNLRLYNQIKLLSTSFKHLFVFNNKAADKLEEIVSICIGRIINTNVTRGKYMENRNVLNDLDLDLYCRYLHPETFAGKVYKFLLQKRCFFILDLMSKFR